MSKHGFKRSAELLPDGKVRLNIDKFTVRTVEYTEALHNSWPDLERPKPPKPKRKRKKVIKDDAEGNAE